MKKLIVFQISENQSIQVAINEDDKVNIYGYESLGLHIFDEVAVKYVDADQTIFVAQDIARYILEAFCNSLEMLLNKELSLDKSLGIGKVGYFFSKKKYITVDEFTEVEEDDLFAQYWVWSSPTNIQTWTYSVDNRMYLEISPTYPWLFSEPEKGENYIFFDEYMNDYKPIALVELSEPLVVSWINECHALLKSMEKV